MKLKTASTALNTTKLEFKTWLPDVPIFLPKKPDTIDPIKGNIIIVKYISNQL